MSQEIRFDDGAAYERFMGQWSQLVGADFLKWLATEPAQRWLDVGCGNGAFTEMIAMRCEPAALAGIDPSEAVLDYARKRPSLKDARLLKGDAMALPFPTASFDVAVMPLVIFFVPEPAQGVAEMVRVVRPGGVVSAYAWDLDAGFPYRVVRNALIELGVQVPEPPSPTACRLDVLRALWQQAGLHDIEQRVFTVERSFTDFDDYWRTILGGPSTSASLRALSAQGLEELQQMLKARLPGDASGCIRYSAWANAVRGRVPATV